MLSAELINLIKNHSVGMVATVRKNGLPAVSPKATFVILDEKTLAFGNIRSPGTLSNIRHEPHVEVCFIDVLTRKAARISGTASIMKKADASAEVIAAFGASWAPYLDSMSAFVMIDISAAELVLSPAYDVGFNEEELKASNLKRLQGL